MQRTGLFQISIIRLLAVVALVAVMCGIGAWYFHASQRPRLFFRKVEYRTGEDAKTSKYLMLTVRFLRDGKVHDEAYYDYQPWGTVNQAFGSDSPTEYVFHEDVLGTPFEKVAKPQRVPEVYQARYDQLMTLLRKELDESPEDQPYGWQKLIELPVDFPTFDEFRDAYVEQHGPEVLRPADP